MMKYLLKKYEEIVFTYGLQMIAFTAEHNTEPEIHIDDVTDLNLD